MASSKDIFVAFLRGINVGGNKIIPMKALAELFENSGFAPVKTILATGNVVFSSKKPSNANQLAEKIEKAISKKFGFEVVVQVKNLVELKKLVDGNPFKQFTQDKTTHWYVTFLHDFTGELPTATNDAYQFLVVKSNALCSLVHVQKGKSTDFMTVLDKTFGKSVTTRNWNTLIKIVNAGESLLLKV